MVVPTGHTTRLPLSTWDRETLRAVAYRHHRRLGARDLLARTAAEAIYRKRHPTVPSHPAWLWKGVGAVRSRRAHFFGGQCLVELRFTMRALRY
jgi:hypothetical protein